MSTLIWFFAGLGGSLAVTSPLIWWLKGKGAAVYAVSRIRAKTGKLFSEPDKLSDPKKQPEVEKSRYWEAVQFSENREDFERFLESQVFTEEKDVMGMVSGNLKEFLKIRYIKKREYDDLKLVLLCIASGRERETIRSLLKTEAYTQYLKERSISDVLTLLKHIGIQGLDYATYSHSDTLGLEYAIDAHYYRLLKRAVRGQILHRLYVAMRESYILENIQRLRSHGYKDHDIISLMRLSSRKEIKFVKEDINILIRLLSEKDEELRKGVLAGMPESEIIKRYYDAQYSSAINRSRLKDPFSLITSINYLELFKKEVDAVRRLWSAR